jgi:hypothetical protein
LFEKIALALVGRFGLLVQDAIAMLTDQTSTGRYGFRATTDFGLSHIINVSAVSPP